MSMKEGETLSTYSDRYWELDNEIRGNNGGVATSTFNVGLPINFQIKDLTHIETSYGYA